MKFTEAWPKFANADIGLRRVGTGWRMLWTDEGLSIAVPEAGHLPGFFVGCAGHVV